MYTRVIPRDLFNESKLLKCLGQLALLVHEGKVPNVTVKNTGRFFEIYQRYSDGGLEVINGIDFKLGSKFLELYTVYNSKENYPLLCGYVDDSGCVEVSVFHEDGTLTSEFCEYLKGLNDESNSSS